MECSRTWVSERTQWSYCDCWGSKKKKKCFLSWTSVSTGQVALKTAASDVPSAKPPPLFSSCWKWPETGLWGQSPAALPAWWNKRGQISRNKNKMKDNRVPAFECASPVVLSWWRRTDAALLHRTRIRRPGCLLHLWRWRRSCLPRARAQSPDGQRWGFFLVGSQSQSR